MGHATGMSLLKPVEFGLSSETDCAQNLQLIIIFNIIR